MVGVVHEYLFSNHSSEIQSLQSVGMNEHEGLFDGEDIFSTV